MAMPHARRHHRTARVQPAPSSLHTRILDAAGLLLAPQSHSRAAIPSVVHPRPPPSALTPALAIGRRRGCPSHPTGVELQRPMSGSQLFRFRFRFWFHRGVGGWTPLYYTYIKVSYSLLVTSPPLSPAKPSSFPPRKSIQISSLGLPAHGKRLPPPGTQKTQSQICAVCGALQRDSQQRLGAQLISSFRSVEWDPQF
ncbi:hypothetical protein DFH09DRAFT_1284676 [Mycena vulgaris]|nr:hypothetical protein DFH09DRAFT_1286589 [Mycena vulgaris]KAJ6532222.1 hypothetical protein DFH09DRAFT_1284676 [Mycena vulgaris]